MCVCVSVVLVCVWYECVCVGDVEGVCVWGVGLCVV